MQKTIVNAEGYFNQKLKFVDLFHNFLLYTICIDFFDMQTFVCLFICMILTITQNGMEDREFPIFHELSNCGKSKGIIGNFYYFKLITNEMQQLLADISF